MPDETNSAAANTGAPPVSPFAAPATTAAAPSTPPSPEGDTSFLDNLESTPPLIKAGTYPAVVEEITEKQMGNGSPMLSISVSLHGDNMPLTNGTSATPGKRVTSTMFLTPSEFTSMDDVQRDKKNLLMALHNVPQGKQGDDAYRAWPPEQKFRHAADLAPFQPYSKWPGTRVVAQIIVKKRKDGTQRNEIGMLMAASTALKGRRS